MRVEHDSGFDTKRTDVLYQTVRVFLLFDMKRDVARLQRREEIDKEGVVLDHKMDIQGFCRSFGDCRDNNRSYRQVRDEVAVHDVDMDKIATGIADGFYVAFKIAEVGREYTWGY